MSICCLDEAGEWGEALRRDGFSVTVLNRQPGFSPSLGRRLAEVAARSGATVLHCHHYSPFVYGMIASFWRPMKVVFTEHGRLSGGPPSPKRRLVNYALSRLTDRVYVVSADLKTHLTGEGFRAAQIEVVPNGIELGRRPDYSMRRRARLLLGVEEGVFVVGVVGRLDPVKDLPTLLRAARLCADADPGIRFALAGDGAERPALEAMVARDQLEDVVTLLGHREDARDLLPGFDLYVNSSVFEGVSLTILEAMAAGLPVVATRVGGTPEVVLDGSTGVLVPARNVDALAAAILDIRRDPARGALLGDAGRARVESEFSIDRMVDRYASVYRENERD
jgi:glycosyltransferase involved in cell wall biosynthesis